MTKTVIINRGINMEYKDLPTFYEKLDHRYNITNNELNGATYTKVDSNFVMSSNYARHRWFYYKEGFSPVLVERIFEECALQRGSVVCDPFCGAGTTLVVAKSKGMKSIGFEVNPFAAFITRAKTANYNIEDLSELNNLVAELGKIDLQKKCELPDNDYLKRIFEYEMLQAQLHIRDFIQSRDTSKANTLLYFAWLCTLENSSLYRKAGNGLKKKIHPPVYETGSAFQFAYRLIKEKVSSIIGDFEEDVKAPMPLVYEKSVTDLNTYVSNEYIDLALFSPPYANCFDYTKIYYLELWFGGFINSTADQKNIRMKSVRSHCHATWPDRYLDFYLPELNDEILPLLKQQELWTNRIPDMLNGYFADMEEALKQVYNSLKHGGHCVIVVSNSSYAGVVIPTDVFLAMIAEKIGFHVEEIEVERLIITSSQQYKQTEHVRKYLRESIVKLSKKRNT